VNRQVFSEPYFHNENAAYGFCQSRLWPTGPVCPRDGCTGGKVRELKGKSTRRGTYKCYGCRLPFTVKIGTVFESSHLELHLWLQAIYLVSFTRGKITVSQLQQTLDIARKTAWDLNRRIRALIVRDDGFAVMDELRSAAILASANATTIYRGRAKQAGPKPGADASSVIERAGKSKSAPKREHGKRPAKPRPSDPKQLSFPWEN
jgi:transposase-like protein